MTQPSRHPYDHVAAPYAGMIGFHIPSSGHLCSHTGSSATAWCSALAIICAFIMPATSFTRPACSFVSANICTGVPQAHLPLRSPLGPHQNLWAKTYARRTVTFRGRTCRAPDIDDPRGRHGNPVSNCPTPTLVCLGLRISVGRHSLNIERLCIIMSHNNISICVGSQR